MTILNLSTKKAQALRASAMFYEGYALDDVYSSCSYAKQEAYKACLNKCEREGGYSFHIYAHNTFGFSVAWFTDRGVRIETPRKSYLLVE